MMQEEKGTSHSPVPMPRPRQQPAAQHPPGANESVHEPARVDYVNTHIVPPATGQSNRPIPAPRMRSKVILLNKPAGTEDDPNEPYENVIVIRRPAPVPNVPKVSHETRATPAKGTSTASSVSKQVPEDPSRADVPAVPPLPGKLNNQLHSERSGVPAAILEVDTLTEENSVDGGAGAASPEPKEGKYKTSSPSHLFKSIGTTTRMLTEAIGERVAHKTKKAAHNVRNTGSSLVSWGTKATLRPTSKGEPSVEEVSGETQPEPHSPPSRPRTLPSPEVMQKIKFGSPIRMNNAATEAGPPLSVSLVNIADKPGADGDTGQMTYDIPRAGNKLSNLVHAPDVPSTGPSTTSSSARASSSSMASSGAGHGLFQRNAPASQSLYSRVLPKHARQQGARTDDAHREARPSGVGALVRSSKHKSESNLYESTFYVERPEPPTDGDTHLYGKLNIIARPSFSSTSSDDGDAAGATAAGSDEDNTLPELLRTRAQLRAAKGAPEQPDGSKCASPSGAVSRSIFSRHISPSEVPVLRARTKPTGHEPPQHRSDSWNFYDIAADNITGPAPDADDADYNYAYDEGLSYGSTPEPVYANDQLYSTSDAFYEQLTANVLQPLPAGGLGAPRHDYDEVTIADIIHEFDPLGRSTGAAATLEAIFENNAFAGDAQEGALGVARGGGNLALIESLLGAESYGRRRVPHVFREGAQVAVHDEGVAGETARACPKPPQRSDSLLGATTPEAETQTRVVPPTPKRTKPRMGSVIVHQNLNLPGSVENLVELDELLIVQHLATVDDGPAVDDASVDLAYPKGPQTSWYLEQDVAGAAAGGRFSKQLTVDPMNERSSVTGRAEKAAKSSLPPELTRAASPPSSTTGERAPEDAPGGRAEDGPVPSYFEAIGGTDPLFERGLAATVAPAKPTSVRTKLLNALKRRSSIKAGSSGGTASDQSSVRTALAMVPRPRLTERFISHKGHVLKFPSGKIGDVLNELSPRSVVLRERIFQTYLDTQQTLPRESIQLRFILSVQCILQHKFTGEGRLDLHCFEIVLGVPKGGDGGVGGGAGVGGITCTNPDMVITSGTSGNVKLTRQSYMFGTHKRSDRNLWMAKVLQSVTDVFGGEADLLREFLRAGWCYVKKSVSASWAGAWLLLSKRRLYLYSYAECQLEELDLRKARCIGAIENEPGSIGNLHAEVGPSLFIDCPPYATLYFVMGSPRETQIWHKVIRQAAHKNGPTLHSQQLTRGDVPVLIDKCVNFIYAHGSMSEGIYRKSGSLTAVHRILQLFGEDAFDVQLTRNEYNEYEVAGALKMFIRELPGSFFGSYAASFVAIGSLSGGDVQLKVDSYRQLLERLPRIEYCTLKKLVGHLAFIASLEKHNRMGVANLAMIWGSTLLTNASQNTVQEPGSYHHQDADVVADLIRLYRRLFTVDEDELQKDRLMLAVLQKYHAAAENLSDAVKHSGDLKVWITVDCDTSTDAVVNSAAPEDKPQVNVDITPVKTASDVCKELAGKTKLPWYKLTLYEVIANGALIRPIHYSEKVLELVVRWTYWDEADRKNNYLTLKPTTTLNDVYRTIQKAPVLTPTMELKFADRKTKNLRNFQLQLVGRGLVVLKKIEKKDKGFEELLKIDLSRMTAYIGCEPKRDRSSLRWAITLVDHDFKKRSRDAPYIGHIFGGLDFASQILWYSSILYSHYKDDILPSGDLFF